jgi:hypothetical protein
MMKLKAFVKSDRSKLRESAAKWLEIEDCVENGVVVGYFLFYFDDDGDQYRDDFLTTLDDIKHNAEYWCEIKPEDWTVVEE